MKPRKDKYLKARGGKYKLYDMHCTECKTKLFIYQKDGPGVLKRCYLDRILKRIKLGVTTQYNICLDCKQRIGIPIIYKKENRLAVRLFVGAIYKRGI